MKTTILQKRNMKQKNGNLSRGIKMITFNKKEAKKLLSAMEKDADCDNCGYDCKDNLDLRCKIIMRLKEFLKIES